VGDQYPDRQEDHGDRDHVERGDERVVEQQSNAVAVAALVTGIIALLLAFLFAPLGALLAIVAVILGIVGLARAARPGMGGRGQAIGGLVTGGIGLLVAILIIGGLIAFLQDPERRQQLEQELQEQGLQTQQPAG
jgi:membrane-bound ClpP family serine protease